MDVARERQSSTRRRAIQALFLAVMVVSVTIGFRALRAPVPSVDLTVLWVDTVQHGTMVRHVRGQGSLVPQQRRFVVAVTAGRVEELHVLPGTKVVESTILLRLSNPDTEVQLLHSQQQLASAQATLLQTRVSLQTELLTQEALVTQLRSLHLETKRDYESLQRLYDSVPQLVAANELVKKREVAAELEKRLEIATNVHELLSASFDSRVAAQREQVMRLESIVQFNENRLASLDVLAGVSGVVADLLVEEGIWVQSGGTLARVDQLGQLKAEIRIPQAQAQDLALGQVALIDTNRDTIQGVVTRIDPTVQNGAVAVGIALPDEMPSSLRADLNVDGIVIIERLEGVMYMSRVPGLRGRTHD